ncbi:MAG TPA: hypothetical protein VK974_00980 [Methylophilaceae bacterium]|nr:hypothetical protein [Methylophilaceae bacterium]
MAQDNLIRDFKTDLTNISLNQITDRIIDQGNCQGISLEASEYIRNKVSDVFNISKECVLIVGSAKLGFSISKKKDKPRYREFSDLSDIDVAIVDSTLFDSYWEDIFNIYCEGHPWNEKESFQFYFFRGWIRPDKFHKNIEFPKGDAWWRAFGELSRDINIDRRKVRGGLYKSDIFLRRYQEICLKQCISDITLGAI